MEAAARIIGGLVALLVTLLAAAPARAASCGDANNNGSVTVTDGVLVLQAAAQLTDKCPRQFCDMNVDGGISVTDGVLALRLAAGVTTTTACSTDPVNAVFGGLRKTQRIGGLASPAGRAVAAGTTTPCPNGGFIDDDGFTLTYVGCRDGDFVTDGTVDLESDGSGTVFVYYSTTDVVISTGEIIDTDGELIFTFGDSTKVEGELDLFSTAIGSYTDEYMNVILDADFFIVSGRIITSIDGGLGFFTNLDELVSTFYSPTLARVFVTYADGDYDLFTFGDGLCEPCGAGCSNPSLTCVSCVGDCVGIGERCGIDFDALICDDGVFGPAGLCDPCASDADCNTSDNLSCFACDSNCTGSTPRCGSSLAFVECVDGVF